MYGQNPQYFSKKKKKKKPWMQIITGVCMYVGMSVALVCVFACTRERERE